MTKKEISQEMEIDLQSGLNNEKIIENKKNYGANELPKEKVTPWFLIFLKTIIEPVQIILLLAAVISVIAPISTNNWKLHSFEDMIDFYVIIAIVFIDGILETIQTLKARKSIAALKSLSEPNAVVIRNGQQQVINSSELVIGDVVILEAGKFVPADLRLVETSDFMVDESILTGESNHVLKTADSLKEDTTILGDMKNICFMSTYTTNGRAIGVVINVGKSTEIGKIASEISASKENKTPLERKLTNFSYGVSIFSFFLAVLIFITLYLTGDRGSWSNYLMIAITLAIGVIPESISAVVSITLSISTKKLAENNMIVKKLSSVEALGSVNVICTDKTGTLTQNRMTVQKLILNKNIVHDNFFLDASQKHKDLFLKALVLCNDSVTEGNERIGDPTELALVDFAENYQVDEIAFRKKYTRIDELPFDSERKMMSTINIIDDQNYVFTKGAIDQLVNVCSKIIVDGIIVEFTEELKKIILGEANKLSSDALRVLAFAYKIKGDSLRDFEKDLIFLGAVGMIDPVRKSAIRAIKYAKEAGISVVMITGDHAITALAIGRDLSLASNMQEVMTSSQLEKLSNDELDQLIEEIHVFARVNPEHKTTIIKSLQRKGNITSMTGDGVNDAPSLSQADIGVAMGITGTDVSKQAADVILTDDNFETIIKGVYEGRNAFQKIRRSIAFVLGVNLANVFAIFLISIINHIAPLEATDILWMNLIIESILAVAIAMGGNDASIMKNKPTKGLKSLFKGLSFTMLLIILTIGCAEIGGFYMGTIFIEKEIHQNGFSSLQEYINSKSVTESDKQNLLSFARTGTFIVATSSPAIYSNFLKLTNWKASKKITFIRNDFLLLISIIVLISNFSIIFIPGINDKLLKLTATNLYDKTNWFFPFLMLAFSFVPTILILLINLIKHFVYHYNPQNWRRNQIIVDEFIKKDIELQNRKKTKIKIRRK